MYTIPRILLAIKHPFDPDHPEIAKAAAIAGALGAEIRLFHALESLLDAHGEVVDECLAERLETLAAPLRARGLRVSTAAAWDLPSHEAIIRGARQFGAGLIITDDYRATQRVPWLRLCTEWELLRTSPVPVLLIRASRCYEQPVILAALAPHCGRHAPGSLDPEILRLSCTLALGLSGTLHAVHGLHLKQDEPILPAPDHEVLQLLQGETGSFRIPPAQVHIQSGDGHDAVRHAAHETGCQIVAIGQVAGVHTDHDFFGSTAENILATLECDILLIKSSGFYATGRRLIDSHESRRGLVI